MDWASLSRKPIATYRDSVGSPINVNLGVRYSTYSDTKEFTSSLYLHTRYKPTVTPTVQLSSNNVSGKVTLTAKTATSLIAKKEYSIVNGLIFGEPMQITSAPSENFGSSSSIPRHWMVPRNVVDSKCGAFVFSCRY